MGACFVVLAVFGIPSAATNARQPRSMATEMRIRICFIISCPIIHQGAICVLGKIDLSGQRHVILHHAFTPLASVFRRTEVCEKSEVVNQVRLVEIPAIQCQLRPVRRGGLAQQRERLLKAPHAAKQLGRNADFPREQLNESPLAEAGLVHYFADRQTGFRPRECIERKADGRGRKPPPRKIVCNDPSGSRRKSATRLRGD